MSRVHQEIFSKSANWTRAFDMDVRIASSGQYRSRGARGSSGHALNLPAHGYWVRDQLCSAGEAFPNRTSPTEWAGPCPAWDTSGAIGAALTDLLQLVSCCQYVVFRQSQRVWQQIQQRVADHRHLLFECMVHAHGRMTASPSCGYRMERQIKHDPAGSPKCSVYMELT